MHLKDFCSLSQTSFLSGGDDVFSGHHLCNWAIHDFLEPQIPVGNNSDKKIVLIDHGDATDLILPHQVQCITDCTFLLDGDRFMDHHTLGPLHPLYLTCLFLQGHVLVNHAYPAFTCNGDGQCFFRNRIHGSRQYRNIQLDVPGELRFDTHLPWENF